jgi:hypothetical protein
VSVRLPDLILGADAPADHRSWTRPERVKILLVLRRLFLPAPEGEDYERLIDDDRDEPRRVKWTIDPDSDDYWRMPCGCPGDARTGRGAITIIGRLKPEPGSGEAKWTPVRPRWRPITSDGRRWAPTTPGMYGGWTREHGNSYELHDEEIGRRKGRAAGEGVYRVQFHGEEQHATRDLDQTCPVCGGTNILVGRPDHEYRKRLKRRRRAPDTEIDPLAGTALDYAPEETVSTAHAPELLRALAGLGDELDVPETTEMRHRIWWGVVDPKLLERERIAAREVIAEAFAFDSRPVLSEMPNWLRVQGPFDELEHAVWQFEQITGRSPSPWKTADVEKVTALMPETIRVPEFFFDAVRRHGCLANAPKGNKTPQDLLAMRDQEIRRGAADGRTRTDLMASFGVGERQLRYILNGRSDRPLGVQHGTSRYVKKPTQVELQRIERETKRLEKKRELKAERIRRRKEPLGWRADGTTIWFPRFRHHFPPICRGGDSKD